MAVKDPSIGLIGPEHFDMLKELVDTARGGVGQKSVFVIRSHQRGGQ